MANIKIGTKVRLLQTKYRDIDGKYTKVEIPVEYEVTDIFIEAYLSGYKVVVKAKYHEPDCEIAFVDTFFLNDFINNILYFQISDSPKGE